MEMITIKGLREVIIKNIREWINTQNWVLFHLSLLLLPLYIFFIIIVIIGASPIVLINNLIENDAD